MDLKQFNELEKEFGTSVFYFIELFYLLYRNVWLSLKEFYRAEKFFLKIITLTKFEILTRYRIFLNPPRQCPIQREFYDINNWGHQTCFRANVVGSQNICHFEMSLLSEQQQLIICREKIQTLQMSFCASTKLFYQVLFVHKSGTNSQLFYLEKLYCRDTLIM